MKMNSIGSRNLLKVVLLTALLGAAAGAIIWGFLKAVSFVTDLVWNVVPQALHINWIIVPLCAAGGLAAGLLHKFYGDYPEELKVVLARVKREKHVSYHPMFIMLLCAFIPLVFGSSVGPEAGLTGIIAALCYWVADNVKFAKHQSAVLSGVGEAVTLGQIFHSPLFGILAVEEADVTTLDTEVLSRSEKLVLYGISTASSFGIIGILNYFFGKAMSGFPSFSEVNVSSGDYLMLVVYIIVGIVMCGFFEMCEAVTSKAAAVIPVVLREIICGTAIGLISFVVPFALFSGEEQMGELIESYVGYAPLFLTGIALLKLFLTAFCLKFGLKGGHFFPVIFACTCMGYGLAMMIFANPQEHAAFAAGIVTSAALGAQMKKPLAVSVLLLLCFPVHFLFWIFLAAVSGSFVANRLSEARYQ